LLFRKFVLASNVQLKTKKKFLCCKYAWGAFVCHLSNNFEHIWLALEQTYLKLSITCLTNFVWETQENWIWKSCFFEEKEVKSFVKKVGSLFVEEIDSPQKSMVLKIMGCTIFHNLTMKGQLIFPWQKSANWQKVEFMPNF
jgi:hypothetical protein